MSRSEVVVVVLDDRDQFLESLPLLNRFYGLPNLVFENSLGQRIRYVYNDDIKDFLQYFPIRAFLLLKAR